MSRFEVDARLVADSHLVANGPLSQLRLMDDTRFAWLVLVPRIPEAFEWIDLDTDAQRALLDEVNEAGKLLRTTSPCDKLNIGALGNVVGQLHVHVVARVRGDAAWPGPVWGAGQALRHPPAELQRWMAFLRRKLPPGDWVAPAP